MTTFRDLHHRGRILLLPNPWDIGSAKVLAHLGFEALATTSGGFAGTLGRADGRVTREEALAHSADIAAATDLPVNGDLENGFGDSPEEVARTISGAIEAGLAGCSIEDWDGAASYDRSLAVERVSAAVSASAGADGFVVTARCEHFLRGNPDLDAVVDRLSAFASAGAGCIYAPGITTAEQIAAVVAIGTPVNVLALPGVPPVAELDSLGVARVSIGSTFAMAATSALVAAATELRDAGTYGFWGQAAGAFSVRDAYA